MMTGAILRGSSVSQAAKLQMVIMFMISASAALASIVTTVGTLATMVDNEHRVRPDRVDVREHVIWRARHWLVSGAVSGIKAAELGGQLLAAAQDGKLDVRMVTEKLRGYWANSK